MEVKHYATISIKGRGFFPKQKTIRVKSNDIKDIKIHQKAIKIVTFDRIVDTIEFQGVKHEVATKRLNQKTYHIGVFHDLKEYLENGTFYKVFADNGGKGIVITRNGTDNLVYNGEEVIDPRYINKEGYVEYPAENEIAK